MPTASVRPLAADDLPAVKAVIASNDLFPPELMDDMAAAWLSGDAPDEIWRVALDEAGDVAGVAYAAPERMTDGTWNLYLIAVRADRHDRGLGAALTREAEREAAARGGRVLLVETSGLPAFARTRAVYAKLGYAEEARIRDFYAAGEDKVVFWKCLDAAEAVG